MDIIKNEKSTDGQSQKYLQKTKDNYITETAYIDYRDMHFLCYSSQIGCPIACAFCYNGLNKNHKRNLSKEEMVGQCTNVIKDLNIYDKNKPIKFACMGVGEPLLNYTNSLNSLHELNGRYPQSVFTLATTGINPHLIPQLASDINDLENFELMISLHASNDETRKKLIPIHQSMFTLKDATQKYKEKTNHLVEWNYVLLDGINDSESNARELCDYLDKGDNVKLTLLSPVAGSKLLPSKTGVQIFKNKLEQKGIIVRVFEPKGKDIGAACGQMASKHYSSEKGVKE